MCWIFNIFANFVIAFFFCLLSFLYNLFLSFLLKLNIPNSSKLPKDKETSWWKVDKESVSLGCFNVNNCNSIKKINYRVAYELIFILQFVLPLDLLVVSAYDGDTDISAEILFQITTDECEHKTLLKNNQKSQQITLWIILLIIFQVLDVLKSTKVTEL